MDNPETDSRAAARQAKLLTTLEQLLTIQATTIKAALDAASNLVAEALAADKVDAFVHEAANNTLIAVGTSSTPMARRQKELGLDRMPIVNGGRSAEVFLSGTSYSSGHVEADTGELVGIRESLGIRSQILVPMEIGGVRRGVLGVSSAQPEAFSADDLSFLQAVSRWVGMVAQHADLVERVTRQAAAEARQLTAEQLITVLAHDIGNHLTPLIGRVYLLRDRAVRDARPLDLRDLDATTRSLERLSRLIADLLDVGRIEQGIFVLARQPVDLTALAQETAALLRTPEASISVSAPSELVVSGDPDRLRQALENLLSNAIKHSPPGTPVQLELRREQRGESSWAVLRVADRGPGIPPELLPQIFERFTSGVGSKGLGLGLYLAQRIAAAHGGSLTAESTLGSGSTFRLALPLA